MMAPFYKFGLFGDETSLMVAFVIGVGFGFFLERAGFGNARLLAAQFYFRDLRVLKVMFTAIITAMVGLYVLSRAGLVDLGLVYLVPTFLVPQIVGGLLLGFGFVIGGYCPGTSCVSAATGRVDGIVYVLGMFAGLLGFGEIYPRIAGWLQVTPMGQITLARLFNIPYGVLVFAVVLMALGAFIAAEWAERRFGGVPPAPDSLTGAPRRLNTTRGLMLGLVALGAIAAVAGNPYREGRVTIETRELARLAGAAADRVGAEELAAWILQGRADYTLVDLRSAADYSAHRIPGARHVPLADLTGEVAPRTEKIVLYAQNDTPAAQAWILLKAQGFKAVCILAGGLGAWDAEVLFPAKPAGETPTAIAEFEKRAAVARHFGGTPRDAADQKQAELPVLAPPPPQDSPAPPAATSAGKKRAGC